MGDAMNQTETTDSPNVDYMRKLHRWRMAFFGLVILLAGLVIGVSSTLMLVRHRERGRPWGPEFFSRRMMDRMQRDLDLSTEQEKKIGAIVKDRMEKLDDIRMEARPRITEQLKLMNEEISAVLTEEQKRIWQRSFRRLPGEVRPPGPGPGEGPRHRGGPPDRMRRGPQRFGPPPGPNRPTVPPEEYEGRRKGQRRKDPPMNSPE